MSLQISRDHSGIITIVDPATGKSETIASGVAGRPVRRMIDASADLPSHQWGKLGADAASGDLPSHQWGSLAAAAPSAELPSHQWGSLPAAAPSSDLPSHSWGRVA